MADLSFLDNLWGTGNVPEASGMQLDPSVLKAARMRGLLGLGAGLLAGSGYSRIPISTGQALGAGLEQGQAGYEGAINSGMERMKLNALLKAQQLKMAQQQQFMDIANSIANPQAASGAGPGSPGMPVSPETGGGALGITPNASGSDALPPPGAAAVAAHGPDLFPANKAAALMLTQPDRWQGIKAAYDLSHPAAPKLPADIQSLQYLQAHPELAAFQRQQALAMKRPAGGAGGGGGYRLLTDEELAAKHLPKGTVAQIGPKGQINLLSKGDDSNLTQDTLDMMATAGAQGYKIQIPALGLRSSGARGDYLNNLSATIKATGMDWPTAVRNMVYGESGIFGSKQAQKTYAATMLNEFSAMKQANIVLDVSSKFPRSEIQSLNRWWTTGKKEFGSPQATQYANAINTFAEEYAKVMAGSNGTAAATDSARQRAHELINEGFTNNQLEGNVALMKREMRARSQGQLDAIQSQIKGLRNFGASDEEGLDQGIGNGGAAPAQGSAPASGKVLRFNPQTGKIEE